MGAPLPGGEGHEQYLSSVSTAAGTTLWTMEAGTKPQGQQGKNFWSGFKKKGKVIPQQ